MADVFVSYSRRDSEFVRRLQEDLESRGKSAWVDVEGIRDAEVFPAALRRAIEGSDAFVFVISPESAHSAFCEQEVNHAVELNKRVVPLALRAVRDDEVPEEIRFRNWIPAGDSDFESMMDRLVTAIDTDLEWERQHTRLTVKALEWEQASRDDNFLLRGSDLAAAEQWLATGADKNPGPSVLEQEYLLAARTAASRRQRTLVAVSLAVTVISLGLLVFALISRNQSIHQTRRAQHEALVADSQRLAIQAGTLTANNLDLALLLARAAYRLDASDTTRRGLLSTLNAAPQLSGFDQRFGSTLGAMALDPDRRTMAIVDQDGSVRLWDQHTDQPLSAAVPAGVGAAYEAKFSPNGRLLAVGGDNGTQLFAAHTLRPIGRRMTDPGSTEWIAFSPDSHKIAASTSTGFLTLRRVPSEQLIGSRLRVSPHRATDVTFTGNSKRVLVGTAEGTLVTVNAVTGAPIGQPLRVTRRGQTYAVEVSPDGKTLLTGDESGQILLWDVASGRRRGAPLDFHHSSVYAIAFSPNGRLFASSDNDGNIAIWETRTGRRLGRLRGDGELAFDLAFTGPRTLISVAADELTRWNLDGTSLERRVDARQGELHALSLSPDQSQFVTGSAAGGTLTRWSVGSMSAMLTPMRTGLRRIDELAWQPGGTILIGGSEVGSPQNEPRHGRIVIWSAQTNHALASLSTGDPGVTTLALSPTGNRFAVGDTNGRVVIWDLGRRRPVGAPLQADANVAYDAAFAPDGRTIATAGDNGDVTLWRVRDGARLWRHATGANVNSIAWRPDGAVLLAGGGLSTLIRLDAKTGKPIGPPTALGVGEVSAITVSADGTQAAVGGFNGQIALVDPSTGALRYALSGQSGRIRQVAFVRHGDLVVSVADDGTVVTHTLDPADWEREACMEAGRNLTVSERHLYLGAQKVLPCLQWPPNQ
jgi:WD40 repeat protein